MSNRSRSLVLAAHGSLAAENSNQPLRDLAKSVADTMASKLVEGSYDVVTPAFLNGEPAITTVLETLPPGDVVVVPVMTSDGYYLRKLTGKLGENSNADQFRLFMTPVLGMHYSIPHRISSRISQLLADYDLAIAETTVVVIGHGTRRNPTSGQATIELTQTLTNHFPELKFETAFLDQDPSIAQAVANIQTRHTLVIPFLISRGPHSTVDVPQAFGLPSGPDIQFPIVKNDDGFCICDLPVGMYPHMDEVCLELAQAALLENKPLELPPVGELTQ